MTALRAWKRLLGAHWLLWLLNLLNMAGPWAVSVGQSLTAPLGTLVITLFYYELRGKGEGTVPAPGEAEGV